MEAKNDLKSLLQDSAVRMPVGSPVVIEPALFYSASSLSIHLFDFPVSEGPSYQHCFELLVAPGTYFVVEKPHRALVDLEDSGHWDLLKDLPGAKFVRDRVHEQDSFVIARLVVYEWTEFQRASQRVSWNYALDVEADAATLMEMVNQIAEDEEGRYDMALLEGSLYLLKELHVHPEFRGQSIGLRMMAHAIQALNRSCSDVFVCQAMPLPSIFEASGSGPMRDRKSVRKLTSYYQQLGFRTWKNTKEDQPIVLWHHCSARLVWQ